jgi:hypothetical protein
VPCGVGVFVIQKRNYLVKRNKRFRFDGINDLAMNDGYKKQYFIYQLIREKEIFYVGVTESIERRLWDHKKKYGDNIEIEQIDSYFGEFKAACALENFYIHEYKRSGKSLENKTGLKIYAGIKCLECGLEVPQIEGKRKKVFCGSTCRSNYWAKNKRKEKKGEDILKEGVPEWIKNFYKKNKDKFKRDFEEFITSGTPTKPIKNKSEVVIKDYNKTTNEKKPSEPPKTNYSINTKSDLDNSEIEIRIKEWQNKKCPIYLTMPAFKKMQEKEINQLKDKLK